MNPSDRAIWVSKSGLGLAAYIVLDSALGDISDVVLNKGVGQIPSQFLALWSKSAVADGVFVVGCSAAVLVGLVSKGKAGFVFAILITWVTYAVAATIIYPAPTFGEGSSGSAGPQNLGYMLVGTPIFGLAGLLFTGAVVLVARRLLGVEGLGTLRRAWFIRS